MSTNNNEQQVVVMEPSALEIITKAEIDMGVATAKQYPRDLLQCKEDVLMLAAADLETAESCFFTLPQKDDDGNNIEGESIRLAEIVASSWSNIKWGKRILSIDRINKRVTAQATVMDMQKNTYAQVEETKNIIYKDGRIYPDHLITTTAKAAQSIALRNAIFQVIPRAFFYTVLKEIKEVAIGNKPGKMVDPKDFKKVPLEERIKKAMTLFGNWGIPEARVLNGLGVKTIEELTEAHLVTLTGIRSGINQGEIKIEDAFPQTSEDKAKSVGQSIVEKVKGKGKEKASDPSFVPPEDQA